MWSLSHWLVLSHTTTSPVWSIAAFTQRVITAGPDRWPHRSLENSSSDARQELINCWNHNLGIWLKEPFYSVRKHGSSPALWEGIIIRKSLKGVLTDGLSYTCRSWNTGFEFFALVSLSHSREFPGLFVFFPTTQKIWTSLRKIRKASVSNLQNTPAVSYQNTDTCRKRPTECYYVFTTNLRAPSGGWHKRPRGVEMKAWEGDGQKKYGYSEKKPGEISNGKQGTNLK